MSSPIKRKLRVHITTMILPELKEALAEEARSDERSMGYVIEQAVMQYLQNKRQTDPTTTRFQSP